MQGRGCSRVSDLLGVTGVIAAEGCLGNPQARIVRIGALSTVSLNNSQAIVTLLGAVVVVALTIAPSHADLYGEAEAFDGNTLMIGGQKVRLYGVDAPELGQTCEWPDEEIECGKISKSRMHDLVSGIERIACKPRGRDNRGQWIAICYADGSDIGRAMVKAGWAMADRQQSLNYIRTEHRAKNAKRGMWKGEFEPPWVWRSLNK